MHHCDNAPALVGAVVPISLLITALVGSGHCIGMCGGIVISVTRTWRDVIGYHLGRLVGYLALGGIAGALGQSAASQLHHLLPFELTIFAAISLIIMGIVATLAPVIKIPPIYGLPVFKTVFNQIFKLPASIASLMAGGFSIFLPCGLLWMALLAAAGSANWTWGIAILGIFWLGTLPAMTLFSVVFVHLHRRLRSRFSLYLGLFWICIGISTILWRLLSLN